MALAERSRRGAAVGRSESRVIEVEVGTIPMDLRLRYPLRWVALLVLVVSSVGAVVMMNVVRGTYYTGTATVLVLKQDDPRAGLGVEIIDPRIQSLAALARSEPFIVEVARRSGVDRTVDQLRSSITATRPKLGADISIQIRDHDQEVVKAVSRQFVVSLGVVVDRLRDGSISVLDQQARDLTQGTTVGYRGPLFQDIFNGRPSLGVDSPSPILMGIAGAGLGELLLFAFCLYAHVRERYSSVDPTAPPLIVPRLGWLPRFGVRRRSHVGNLVSGAMLAVDASSPGGLRSLAFLGVGLRRERASVTVVCSAAMAPLVDRPIVIVDMDPSAALSRRCGLSPRWPRRNRPGLGDAVGTDVDVSSLLVPLRRRALPRSVRRLWSRDAGVSVLGYGRDHDGPLPEHRLVSIVDQLATTYTVVLHLPDVPGPQPISEVLSRCDVTVLVVLDGWTPVGDAGATAQAMETAAPGRGGFLLLENR